MENKNNTGILHGHFYTSGGAESGLPNPVTLATGIANPRRVVHFWGWGIMLPGDLTKTKRNPSWEFLHIRWGRIRPTESGHTCDI